MKNRIGFSLMVLFLAGLTGAGFLRSFRLEEQGGRFYLLGSSLRADPKGTRILHDSLEQVPQLTVQRNAMTWSKIKTDLDPATTLLLEFNSARSAWIDDTDMVDFLDKGGRVLITPPRLVGGLGDEVMKELDEQEEVQNGEQEEEEENEGKNEKELAAENWLNLEGIELESISREIRTLTPVEPNNSSLPPLEWTEVMQVFTEANDWEILVRAGEDPFLLRKERGNGEVFLMADTELLLNKRLFTSPPSGWIHWLLQDSTTVIFQEAHLGLNHPQSLTALMWEQHLIGLVPALFLPFLLLAWRTCQPFLPVLPPEEEPEQGPQGHVEGTRELLTRYIPTHQILPQCLDRWVQTPWERISSTELKKRHAQGQAFLAGTDSKQAKHLPELYKKLDHLINQKRKRT